MGSSSVAGGAVFFFGGRDDLGIPWGASVGVRMVRVRYRYGAERESGPLPDGIAR